MGFYLKLISRHHLQADLCFALLWTAIATIFLPQLVTQAEILPVKTYTAAHGLPRDAVWKVRQDARGFLWFCSSEGLVRFDGYNFKLYTKDDGLPSKAVTDFLQARDGSYWIGTVAGLVRFNPNGVRRHAEPAEAMFTVIPMETPPPKPRLGQEVNAVYEDPQGTIWVAMEDGLNKLVSEKGRTVLRRIDLPFQNKLGYLPIRSIFKDKQGILWIGAEGAPKEDYASIYCLFPDEKLGKYYIKAGNAISFLETQDNNLWVGFGGDRRGLCQVDRNRMNEAEPFAKCYLKKDGLPHNWIMALRQTKSGAIWVGTAAGAAQLPANFTDKDSIVKIYRSEQGVCGLEVMDIFEDRDNNLWISTSCGVTKLVKNGFTRYDQADGIASVGVFTIFNDQTKRLVIGTRQQRTMMLSVFDKQRFTRIRPNLPTNVYPGWGWGQYIINSSTGDWWFPSGANLLYRFRNIKNIEQLAAAKPQLYGAQQGFTDEMVWQMYEDKRGDVWISTSYQDKLLRWNHDTEKISDVSAAAENPRNVQQPNSYAEDKSGTLWMGSGRSLQSRLIRYRNGSYKVFGQADGLPFNDSISAVFVDNKDRLWMATGSSGVGRIDDLKSETLQITWYNRNNGLSTNKTESLVEDQFGRIYIGNVRGVDCLTPETGQVRSFTTADGLPKDHIYVSARDAQGALWFGSPQGVARFIPEAPKPNQPPTIFLTAVRVAGIAQPVSEIGELSLPQLELSPSQTNVTLEFLSSSATSDPHIRYQYKLEGQSDWSAPAEQRTIDFANLSAGTYSFYVRAINADGIYSATPASVSFRVAAPLFRRWWFIALSVLVIGGLAYAAYRYRVKQLLALERMRMRIAADLHDEVGSSLSQISILSEAARQRFKTNQEQIANAPEEPLEKVAVTAREALDAMSDLVWAINPARDQLSDLSQRMRRFASDTLTAKDVTLRFNAPQQEISLDADVRRQVFLIFKEAINNIVRHANATVVEVNIALHAHHLSLQINDNGVGFVETAPSHESAGGNGLFSMRRRANALGAQLEIVSKTGEGTALHLKTPLHPART